MTNETSDLATPFKIYTPLLAFEQVFRHTGTIRKKCLLENNTESSLELRVRYSFKEHSWLQIYSEQGRLTNEDDLLVIEPGETQVYLLLNTDSSNFPYDQFRGRIYFDIDGGTSSAQWLEISFEQIQELEDFAGYAAIDLGTSNSMMALYHLQQDAVRGEPWSPVLEANERMVPSAVFLRDLAQFRKLAPESCAVGRAALSEYAASPTNDPRSLQIGVKRLIGNDRMMAADAFGAGGPVDPRDILHMLGRNIRERAQSDDNVRARLRKLIVTFPPTWDYRQISRWKEIFYRLGFQEEDLDLSLDEASAAGLFYVFRWTQDADSRNRLLQDLLHSRTELRDGGRLLGERYGMNLLTFDFGGGTIDLAMIRVDLTVLDDIIRMKVTLLGSDSMNYGGDQVTLAAFRILKRRLALGLTDPGRLQGEGAETQAAEPAVVSDDQSGFYALPSSAPTIRSPLIGNRNKAGASLIEESWKDIERQIAMVELPQRLEDAVDSVFPTRFWRSKEEPISGTAKRNFAWLWEQAEALKRELFREARTREQDISLSEGDNDDLRGGLRLDELPEHVRAERRGDPGDAEAWVTVGEIYEAIRPAMEEAIGRARRLAEDERIDRVVLTGQSSWIPLVRRLFMRPKGDGGFGLGPNRVWFDENNAKEAVCKGACLLRVMRDAMVGFDVDVSDFKANLLSEIFYKNPLGNKRKLFLPGPIDDLRFVQEQPDAGSFARHLALFYGSGRHLLGQFDFGSDGELLPQFEPHAERTLSDLGLSGAFPGHPELVQQRERDAGAYSDVVSAMRDWPERAIVAWIEAGAEPGTSERPIYRYYLTRNRTLLAVQDRGDAGKKLFPLRLDDGVQLPVSAEEDPFSGVH